MSSVDRKKLEKQADNILAKDPKTQLEKALKKRRARMTEARYAKVVANRIKPNLLTEAMKHAWDRCQEHDEHDT
jgi:hypothetical protein